MKWNGIEQKNLHFIGYIRLLRPGWHSNRKEFVPLGSKFFPVRVPPQNKWNEVHSIPFPSMPVFIQCPLKYSYKKVSKYLPYGKNTGYLIAGKTYKVH